jgi:hypothetical protein
MRIVLLAVIFAIVAGATAALGRMASWRDATAARVAALEASSGLRAPELVIDAAALPPAAARYFARALGDGPRRIVKSAVATQEAEFFINGGWRPLTATQHFTTTPAGLVWDARIAMAPLVAAWVRDSYVGGRGAMQASLLGVYTLVDQQGVPALDAGALQRFLGEAVWFPTALLPSPAVQWSAGDDLSATVTLTDHDTTVALRYHFDGSGDVVKVSGDRFKESGGRYTLQPWVIGCGDHAERGGMRIPLYCEVSWIGEGGPEPYWRGRITTIDYAFQPELRGPS